MKICLICEGSYPFVAGGVSSWLQSLIRQMPDQEFVVWAIGANESQKGQYKYEIPENVTRIEEVFLDSVFQKERTGGESRRFTEEQYRALRELIACGDPDWKEIFDCYGEEGSDPVEFLLDPVFLQILKEVCREKYSHLGFTDLFWTLRSMFLPLLHLLHTPVPEADLYHAVSCGYAGVLGAMAAVKKQKPFVLTEHGIYTREREEEILRADWVDPRFKTLWIDLFYLFSRCAYRHADVVTCLFRHAAELQQELGCPAEKQMVIPNGINMEDFGRIPLKAPDGWIDIGAIVRLVPIKDIKTMLFSYAIACAGTDRLRLHVMGPTEEDPEYFEECRLLAEDLHLENCIFTGRVNTKEYLKKIDFTLLTSISEGMPLSTLEGMAAGRPAVVTNVGSCASLISGDGDGFGDAGICVPAMHQRAIAEAMLRLAAKPALIRRMGTAGQRRVKASYTIGEMIENYRRAYREAESRARRRVLGETWQESDSN